MKKQEFKDWLLNRGYKENTADSIVSRVERIDDAYNIQDYFIHGEEKGLMDIFEYSLDDYKNGILPSVSIPLSGNYYNILASLRGALRQYFKFLKAPQAVTTTKKKRTTHIFKAVRIGVALGPDNDCGNVVYKNNISMTERVPGLAEFLCMVYEDVLGFARNAFGNLFRDLYKIPVILRKEQPTENYQNDDKTIAKLITRYVRANPERVYEEDIERILKLRDYEEPITGLYHSNRLVGKDREQDPYIEIFYNNISARNRQEFFEKAAMTLAHEIFHHIHDCNAPMTFNLDPDNKENKIVKESLADFFSALYIIARRQPPKVAEERYYIWKRMLGTSWSYAYAYHFYRYGTLRWRPFSDNFCDYANYRIIDKFIDVFQRSQFSMHDAYSRLNKVK